MTIPNVPSLREQDRIYNEWLNYRLANMLPDMMQRTDIDCWLVLAREYNEDPVIFSLLPATSINASRLTGFVYHLNAEGKVDCYSLTAKTTERYGTNYTSVWAKGEETQYECLARLLRDLNPKAIGINISEDFALADGLSKTLYEQLTATLNEDLRARLVSAEKLAIAWLETRSPMELERYHELNAMAHGIIAEGFSRATITPGMTTTTDVEYAMLQRAIDLGLGWWFHFDVDRQYAGEKQTGPDKDVIQAGDLLHCDIGIICLRLKTDTQRLAYVLREDETAAPDGLVTLMASANQFQDIVSVNMDAGKTGNTILAASLAEAKVASLNATLYNHPIGVNGHAAGTLVGLWDHQEGVRGRGDYPLYNNTCHALELNTKMPVPEWDDKVIQAGLEQTIGFIDGQVVFFDGRETELILI